MAIVGGLGRAYGEGLYKVAAGTVLVAHNGTIAPGLSSITALILELESTDYALLLNIKGIAGATATINLASIASLVPSEGADSTIVDTLLYGTQQVHYIGIGE